MHDRSDLCQPSGVCFRFSALCFKNFIPPGFLHFFKCHSSISVIKYCHQIPYWRHFNKRCMTDRIYVTPLGFVLSYPQFVITISSLRNFFLSLNVTHLGKAIKTSKNPEGVTSYKPKTKLQLKPRRGDIFINPKQNHDLNPVGVTFL